MQYLLATPTPGPASGYDRRRRRVTRNIVERISVQTLRIRRVMEKSILLEQWRDVFCGEKTIYCTREFIVRYIARYCLNLS